MDYRQINQHSWDQRTALHLKSDFYKMPAFLAGASSLNPIELELLGDLKGKKVLHLQCHFGQDSISLARMGAEVTAVDFSNKAIEAARDLAEQCGESVNFIASDVYALKEVLQGTFDWVFSSYGVIGWLPDMEAWADIVSHYTAADGRFLLVEFHPVLWMFDDAVEKVAYPYFNHGPIKETLSGSYADPEAEVELSTVTWNHDLAEVFQSLLNAGLQLRHFQEFDYSPYPIFQENVEIAEGRYQAKAQAGKIPLVYAAAFQKTALQSSQQLS